MDIKDLEVFAIDADNNQVLTFEKTFGSAPDKIVFRSFDDLATPLKTWELAHFADKNGFEPKHGFFTSENRMLTLGDHLVMWDVDAAEPIYVVELERRGSIKREQIAFGPNQKVLAFVDDAVVSIINIEEGLLQGSIAATKDTAAISISPSGEFLAALERKGQIWVWDLTSNELIREFKSDGRESVQWVDERNLLVDNKYLMDVEYRVCAWEYKAGPKEEVVSLGLGDFLLQTKTHYVVLELPHADISNKIENLDPEDLLLIKPGDEFAVDFDLPFDEQTQSEILDGLEDRLASVGYAINNQAAMTIRGRVKKQDKQRSRVTFPHAPHFRQRDPVYIDYTPHRSTVEVLKEGKVIWETSYYHGPSHYIHTQGDETLQEHADRVSNPNARLFLSFEIPKNLATLPGGKPLGRSSLSTARRKRN